MRWRFSTVVSALGLVFSGSVLSEAQPSISSGGIVSAAAFGAFSSIAPGSWIEIYGSNLANNTRSWATSDFNGVNAPTSLDGTSVKIGGQAAFIDYISPGQVNAQVPSTVGTGTQPVVVTAPAGVSAAYSITVNLIQPGLLAPPSFVINGQQNVAALFSDGTTYVLPPGSIAGVASKRAQPGEIITLYGIGFGPVTPDLPAGQIVNETNSLALPAQFLFASTDATASYSGLAPAAVGLYQFNLTVPNISGSDSVPVTFNVGGVSGTQVLYIAIQSNAPPQPTSLVLSPTMVSGGGSVQGTVTLSTSAPAGGVVVMLSSSSASVSVPPTVTVPEGATSATFTVSTSAITSSQSVTLTASYGGNTVQASLMVTAAGALPQFTQIDIGATFLFNQITYGGTAGIETLPGSTSYSYAALVGLDPTSATTAFAVAFGTVSVVGDTFTFTNVMLGPNSLVGNPTGQYGITAGSATITLAPSGAPSVGNVTGSFTVTSALGTMTGTISGTYTAQ
jgi:uncharacterized protein (TIGR03437 family)